MRLRRLMVGISGATRIVYGIREFALHRLIIVVHRDRRKTLDGSMTPAERISDIVFAGKARFGVPEILLVEEDRLLADRFSAEEPPVKGSFEKRPAGRDPKRVLAGRHRYGFS